MKGKACRGRYGLWILIAAVLILVCMDKDKRLQDAEDMEPDLVRAVSIDDSHYLTVVAYVDRIEDKENFARMIVEMYRQDRFQTIKVSRGRAEKEWIPGRLYIKVYLQKEDIRKGKAVFQIKVEDGRHLYLDGVEIDDIR